MADSDSVPTSIFGQHVPTGTGLPGSEGGHGGDGVTTQAGSDPSSFAGTSDSSTGMPGSSGSGPATHDQSLTVSNPNNFSGQPGGASGNKQVTATGHNDPYPATGMAGTPAPDTTGIGSGSVKVGGFKKGRR